MKYSILLFLLIIPDLIFSQAPTQTIRGTVLDKAAQTPIIGATIVLVNSSPLVGTISDKSGNFKLKNVAVGRHELKVTYIGYKENNISNILVNSGKEVVLNINLEESVVQSKEIVVQAEKDLSMPNNDLIITSVTNLRPETINRFAGSKQDVSRIAASCAGVAGGDDARNDIIVRGNSPMGVLWRLEGVDIPNPNHFAIAGNTGGPFAVINNNLLDNTDFITGAFPSEYGNKTAAVFDVKLRNGNNEKREYTFQLGMNGVEAGAEGPFASNYTGSYLVNFRYMTLEPLQKIGVDFGENMNPTFMDGALKINLPTKSYGNFNLWGIFGQSDASIMRSEDENIDWDKYTRVTDENINEYMYAIGLTNTHFLGENLFGVATFSNSVSRIHTHNELFFKDKTSKPDEYFYSREGQYLGSYTLNYKANTRNYFKAGVSYRNMFYRLFFWEWDDWFSQYLLRFDSKNESNLFQSFLHWRYRISDDLETDAGLFYQLFTLNNSYAIEPRLSIKYQLTEKQSLAASYGMHSQTHTLIYYFFEFYHGTDSSGRQIMDASNKNLDLMRAHHGVLSYQYQIFSDFRIKAEAYYQYLYDVPICVGSWDSVYSFINVGAEFSFNAQDSTANKGTGQNFGIELTAEKYFSHGYYVLLTASLFKSKYTANRGIERSTAFDIGHVMNLLAGKEFSLDSKNQYVFSFDMKLNYSGGRRVIPIDIEASQRMGYQVRDVSRAYDEQLKDYFRIDLKLTLNINLESTTHNIFIAVDNLLDTKNLYKQEWDPYAGGIKNAYQIGLVPYLGYRVNF